METENLKKALEALRNMDENDCAAVSRDPQKAFMDLQIYVRCKEKGNMRAWENLKLFRNKL